MNIEILSTLLFSKLLPLAYALIGFGLLITIHECGHFLFCKLFRIHTPTFSIGMGPTLFKKKVGETNFRLALIPIGGYVEIAGMAEVGQGDQEHAVDAGPRSFRAKPFWQKILVLSGGIIFNIVFAYGVFSTLYFVGMPNQTEVQLVVAKVKKSNVGEQDMLQKGDKLIGLDGIELSKKPKDLFPVLKKVAEKFKKKNVNKSDKSPSVTLHLERAGKKIRVVIPVHSNGSRVSRGLIGGASFDVKTLKVEYERYPFFTAIKKGVQKTNAWVGQVFSSLKMLVTKRNIKDFGGPVMIVSESFKMAQKGILLLLLFLAIISINLAVINLLPIGALDGGQILFETIEAIIRRPIPDVIRFSINLVSWVLILGLILFLSYQDILALFLR